MSADPAGGVPVSVLPMGDAALLLETDDTDAVLALDHALRQWAVTREGVWAEVDDIVPAARTVLLVARPTTDLTALAQDARRAARDASGAAYGSVGGEVEIEVRYDGPDLDEVAALTGMTREEVVAAHTGTPWRVGFGGFAPGFAYLVDGDPRLRVPRRESPRTSVPAGSVGLAGEFSGVYPRSSPGGWQLIGTTDAVLWDADRDPPALLVPGMTVRFTPFSPGAGNRQFAQEPQPCELPVSRSGRKCRGGLEVLEAGVRTLVQDAGRVGHMAVGVGRAGAADGAAYRLGQRLLGNPPGAAALEVTLGGLSVRARGELLVCLTGAPLPATVAGREAGHAAPLLLGDGEVLTLGRPTVGLRTYLSVRGGIDVEPVLGSRSTDTMSGLGPPPVAAGQVLPVGPQPHDLPLVDQAPLPPLPHTVVLRVTPGPRAGWLADPIRLTAASWVVSDRSDRKGVRLEGARVERHAAYDGAEVPSEGMVRGAIQLPPNGEPVVFLSDHPVTGGYPVVAVVRSVDVDLAAQLTPGQRVRLAWDTGAHPHSHEPPLG